MPRPNGSPAGDYLLRQGKTGTELVVTGSWSPDAARAVREHKANLVLNYALGFDGTDVEFLRDLSDLNALTILHRGLADLSAVESLTSLQALSVDAGAKASIDVSALPQLRYLSSKWAHVSATIASATELVGLHLSGFDGPDLCSLPDALALTTLRIKGARKLQAVTGVERFRQLRVLLLAHAPRLSDLTGLEKLSTLEELELELCKSISSVTAVRTLPQLQFLGFSDCGAIASLGPLRGSQTLEVLHAWGTTLIEDADLTPLTTLPRMNELRMKSRRAYRPSVEEIKAARGIRD